MLEVEIWSDYVCPFCYLHEPVVDELAREFGDLLTIRWRAYELRPDPVPTLEPRGDYLRDIWQSSVYPMAEQRGMKLKLPPVQPRSRLAHEATEFARDRGKADEMRHAIFAAFFEEGRDIGEPDILGEIGERLEIHPTGLKRALEGNIYSKRVLRDEREAHEIGFRGVPAAIFTRSGQEKRERFLISGVQPLEHIREAVQRLLADGRLLL